MKHRDRVLTALHHELPDRCPMQISFTPEFADRLRREIQIEEWGMHNPHGGGNTYDLERALDEDMLLTSVGWGNSYYQSLEPYVDEWGVHWRPQAYHTPFGTGHYTEIVHHPLADDAAVASYKLPDPRRPELYRDSERMLRAFKDEYWIVGATVTTMFEAAWALRGLEQMMIDFLENPDLADQIFEFPFRYHLAAACKLVEMGVDMIWIGDDVGAQYGMLISPQTWRRFLKPRVADFIAALKAINPAVKVAYHSDGNILPIIPELIEIGVDILNPIQPACMEPEQVKKQFGDKLCFWGSIDEQYTLPRGTPEYVSAEVLQRLRTIGANGGLIIGPSHHVQLDTPLENFWAMVNTIRSTPYHSLGS